MDALLRVVKRLFRFWEAACPVQIQSERLQCERYTIQVVVEVVREEREKLQLRLGSNAKLILLLVHEGNYGSLEHHVDSGVECRGFHGFHPPV